MQEKVCENDSWNQWALAKGWTGEECPELNALRGVQQSPVHHPEGDAYNHTLLVVNAMEGILDREKITGRRRGVLMLAALCHDFGKATTTKWREDKQKWTAYGHDEAGVPIARGFLERIGAYPDVIERVLPLVWRHMAHCRPGFTRKAVNKLINNLRPSTIPDLLLLMSADSLGRGSASSPLPRPVLEELVPIYDELALGLSPGVLLR